MKCKKRHAIKVRSMVRADDKYKVMGQQRAINLPWEKEQKRLLEIKPTEKIR